MPITKQQLQMAQQQQHQAAHDPSSQVRVVAGPGSGKSFTIQERALWLLNKGLSPESVFIVSFTRASTRDLRDRIFKYCTDKGQPSGCRINVSTLHSLALRALRSAGLLVYPADPLVLDNWELKNILDQEFSNESGFRPNRSNAGYPPARARYIRQDYEAFCGTGQWIPPSYIAPNPPIALSERKSYEKFHRPRTQLYSCVLPGEIVRQCVEHMHAGSLDPQKLLGIQHLVVDEYQDLNPSDLEFVDLLANRGVTIFVGGDDDQSLYSFRFASPHGIQSFTKRFPQAADHQLSYCFRSTTNVLGTAQKLMVAFSDPTRIPKHLVSLYDDAAPPEPGVVFYWKFQSGIQEAKSIAMSCSELIKAGLAPREIMILVSDTKVILPTLVQAFKDTNTPFESPRTESFIDTPSGRLAVALIRIVCDRNDYIAHRLLFGLRPGVGPGTCNEVAHAAITNNLNYHDIFYQNVPKGIFKGRSLTSLNNAKSICAKLSSWQQTDTIMQREGEIYAIVETLFGSVEADLWRKEIAGLPVGMNLVELRDYFGADNDEQRASLLQTAHIRLGLPEPPGGFLPDKIRLMTMHGAKGLSATVVFTPGLEEDILPGVHRRPYPGLVLEAARMLYVSITRARAACVLSYAQTRIVYGNFSHQTPSRFVSHLGGEFGTKTDGLDPAEIRQIMQSKANL